MRLWDLLAVLRSASKVDGHNATYCMLLNESGEQNTVELKAQCGPGDDAEPVLTVMFPDED